MDELKASLLAHGLMQNLVVTDTGDGVFRVIAGGRRLEAIHSLQAEGKLPENFAVPCQVVNEEHAREMSLAENTVRLAMHPADQFEAFAGLIEGGATASEVAQRFGKEINGLQAGLGFRPGQKRAYSPAETVTLVVRVRNVGKETMKLSYLHPFMEHSPAVTDSDGKAVPQPEVLPA